MPNIIVMVIKYYLLSEDIVPFTTTDIEVMAEFLEILKPVSCALDKLQSEKNAYMGVLPQLWTFYGRSCICYCISQSYVVFLT